MDLNATGTLLALQNIKGVSKSTNKPYDFFKALVMIDGQPISFNLVKEFDVPSAQELVGKIVSLTFVVRTASFNSNDASIALKAVTATKQR